MNLDTLLRAAQILRAQPACTMSLLELHARLRTELGAAAGTYAQLQRELKRRPQSFLLFDSPRLTDATRGWPAHVREDYDRALENSGLADGLRVALTELPMQTPDGPLGMAGNTVGELWRCAEQDAIMRQFLDSAASKLEEISSLLQPDGEAEHPTTPAPDLPPAP